MKKDLNTLLNRVDTRLAACAAAAAATVAVAPSSEATIIWSGPVAINDPSTFAGIYLNVVNGLVTTTQPANPGWDLNPYGTANLSFFSPTGGGMVGGGTNFFNLAPGTLISAASTFATGSSTFGGANPLALNSSNNIFGFRFTNEALGNQVQFGWIRISLAATSAGQPRTVVEYAYENTGLGIAAGAIPEPTTFALLGVMAAGALGVRVWRKGKAA